MLFGRKIRTKLPELSDVHVEQEVRDRDNKQKSNSKAYGDMQRNARYPEVLPGDQVLVQQERKNKLTTRFEPRPYTVVNMAWEQLDSAICRRSPILPQYISCKETAREW